MQKIYGDELKRKQIVAFEFKYLFSNNENYIILYYIKLSNIVESFYIHKSIIIKYRFFV